MLIFTRSLRVCLAVEPCDLRASFEKLAVLVKERLGEPERQKCQRPALTLLFDRMQSTRPHG